MNVNIDCEDEIKIECPCCGVEKMIIKYTITNSHFKDGKVSFAMENIRAECQNCKEEFDGKFE